MITRLTLLLICNLSVTFSLFAKKPTANASFVNKPKQLSFIENKGQIVGQDGNHRGDIDAKLDGGNGLTIFVGDGALHYQWSRALNVHAPANPVDIKTIDTGVQVETYRMDVVLIGANKNAQLVTEQQQGYYENYYLPQCPDGAVAHSFNKITYKNIYPNIDWVLYSKGNELKYDFIVHAGGDYTDIKLKYEGATALTIHDGALIATTPLGSVTEQKPFSYDVITREEILSRYKLEDDILSFDVARHSRAFIIDPSLEWATYFGGSDFDGHTKVKADKAGNVYLAGSTNSVTNIATTGAFQDTFGGVSFLFLVGDEFLVKYNVAGVKQWATYYGGNNSDYCMSVTCDNLGYIYLAGRSSSTSPGLTTPGAYQPHRVYNSAHYDDYLLVKFNSAGGREWATFYGAEFGGSNADGSITCDDNNNVYMCGMSAGDTAGTPNPLATPGSHQVLSGGGGDAFFVKFNSLGQRLYGTLYGGERWDRGQAIVYKDGYIYMAGETTSSTNISTPGAHRDSYNWNDSTVDAFLVKFDTSGIRQWATYYGGETWDEGLDLAADKFGNIYMAGTTRSTTGIATANSFKPDFFKDSTFYDAFLVKFNNAGARQWGTYYGGAKSDFLGGIATDRVGRIYITGSTLSSTGIATPDAYQPQHADSLTYDMFTATFDPTGNRLWGTYYGGPAADLQNYSWGGEGMDLSGGQLFIAGMTLNPGLATPGSDDESISGGFDALLISFRVAKEVELSEPYFNTALCAGDSFLTPYAVTADFDSGNIFTAQLSDATGSFGNAVNIGSVTATKSGTIAAVIPANTPLLDGYRIRIIASSPADISNDNGFDISIGAKPGISATSNSPVCEGNPVNLTVNSGNPNVIYNWIGPAYASSSQNVNFDKAELNLSGKHYVKVTANGCSARDTVDVVVNPKPKILITAVDETVCKGDSLKLSAETDMPTAVYWRGPSEFASNLASNVIFPVAAFNSGVYSLHAISTEGCSSDTLNKEVNVVDLKVRATTNAQLLYYGDTLHLSTVDNPAETRYEWSGPGGFVSDMQHPQVPDVTDKQQGDYYVTASLSGCSVKDKVYQQVLAARRFKLFPNPNKGNFTIKGRILKDQEVPIEIINYMGQVVYRDHTKAVNYRFEKTISLEGGFTNGLYFVRLGIDGKTEDLRFILAR